MFDSISELSTKNPRELLPLEDGWAEFLNLPQIEEKFKDDHSLKRFQEWIIFSYLTDNIDNQVNYDLANENDNDYVFDILSGKSMEELSQIYNSYQSLLEKANQSPFQKNIPDNEVIDRFNGIFLSSLFDFFCQRHNNPNNNQLILSLARFLRKHKPFGIKIDKDGCFSIIFNPDTVEKNTDLKGKKNKKKPPESQYKLFYQIKDNGSCLIYTPSQSSSEIIGDFCLEIRIFKPPLINKKETLSYQGINPANIDNRLSGSNHFGDLKFVHYSRGRKEEIEFALVETNNSSLGFETTSHSDPTLR